MEPLLVPVHSEKPGVITATKLMSLSRTKVKALVKSGELASVLVDGRRLVIVEDIREYIRARQNARGAA